jgi:hypothetical protein
VAQALYAGLIYEEDGTFKTTEGTTQEDFEKLGLELDIESLDDFDNEVYDSAEELRAYG